MRTQHGNEVRSGAKGTPGTVLPRVGETWGVTVWKPLNSVGDLVIEEVSWRINLRRGHGYVTLFHFYFLNYEALKLEEVLQPCFSSFLAY